MTPDTHSTSNRQAPTRRYLVQFPRGTKIRRTTRPLVQPSTGSTGPVAGPNGPSGLLTAVLLAVIVLLIAAVVLVAALTGGSSTETQVRTETVEKVRTVTVAPDPPARPARAIGPAGVPVEMVKPEGPHVEIPMRRLVRAGKLEKRLVLSRADQYLRISGYIFRPRSKFALVLRGASMPPYFDTVLSSRPGRVMVNTPSLTFAQLRRYRWLEIDLTPRTRTGQPATSIRVMRTSSRKLANRMQHAIRRARGN